MRDTAKLAREVLSDIGMAAAALAASLLFFAPHLWLFRQPTPGSFEWSRGLTYLAQCAAPFDPGATATDPAMYWRLLPALVCHGLRLSDWSAFLIPWLGIIALLATVTRCVRRYTSDRRTGFLAAVLTATTAAVCVPTGWLGINDAWYLTALLVVAFGRGWPSVVLPVLLGPWIDERFVLGLPIAGLVRYELERREPASFGVRGPSRTWVVSLGIAALTPYAAARLLLHPAGDQTGNFLAYALHGFAAYLSFVPLGLWMGLRAAWIYVGLAVLAIWSTTRASGLALKAAAILGPLAVETVTASDTCRNTSLLVPLALLGVVVADGGWRKRLLLIAAIGLLLPMGHVTNTKFALVSPLPIEIIRLFRAYGP